MSLEEIWQKIHTRLTKLDFLDQEEEAELLSQAYENLLSAYQESRSLNYEMASLVNSVCFK